MQRYAKVFIHANENAEKSSLNLYFFHTIIYGMPIREKSLNPTSIERQRYIYIER